MAKREFNQVVNRRIAYRLLSDILDSTTTPLTSGSTYTGDAKACEGFKQIVGTFYADQDALIRIQFRNDGANWDGQEEIDYVAGNKEKLSAIIAGNEVRLEVENDSGIDMTTMRAHLRGLV